MRDIIFSHQTQFFHVEKMSFFFSDQEKERFGQYITIKESKSYIDQLGHGVFSNLSRKIPKEISPNVLSLASALFLVQGWYITNQHESKFPVLSSLLVIVCIVLFFGLDQIDAYHAKNIGNDSSFVDLFDHVCSTIGLVFLGLTMSKLLFIFKENEIWFVQKN